MTRQLRQREPGRLGARWPAVPLFPAAGASLISNRARKCRADARLTSDDKLNEWTTLGGRVMSGRPRISWPVCETADCTGIKLPSGSRCLVHADESDRDDAFNQISAAGVIDARGVQITDQLLKRILAAVPRSVKGEVLFKGARFDHATFTCAASFSHVTFSGAAVFSWATFLKDAIFAATTFSGGAVFKGATFNANARFGRATIASAVFSEATFNGGVAFAEATLGDATFSEATFNTYTMFDKATFVATVLFVKTVFNASVAFNKTTFTGHARFDRAVFKGRAEFNAATFSYDVEFDRVTFSGLAGFDRATFKGHATFLLACFSDDAVFSRVRVSGGTNFDQATFSGHARFDQATIVGFAGFSRVIFSKDVRFDKVAFAGSSQFSRATFAGHAIFDQATFTGRARFDRTTFAHDARFYRTAFRRLVVFAQAKFEEERQFGPILAYRGLVLDGAEFLQLAQIEISTIGVCCREARFPQGVQFRLRWARIILDGTDFPAPSILTGIPRLSSEELAEQEERISKAWQRLLAGKISEQPQLVSLMRANVAGIGLSNISVADCRFAGSHNLDEMRLEADVNFASAPSPLGMLGREGRLVIAEERDWRAGRPRRWAWQPPSWPDWLGDRPKVLDAGQIADLYRALRKGREDAKNEPGAAYFYYGEMEMRRHASTNSAAERVIIWLYWLISGYGLRALRSLAVLIALGVIVTTALTGWGLGAAAPVTTPPQQLTGTVSTTPHKPTQINATLSGITPQLPRADQRWTRQRAQTALEVTLESFAFRSADQPLTAAGTWIAIAARISGPVLLALTLLALRNRVKR